LDHIDDTWIRRKQMAIVTLLCRVRLLAGS
jgi:hypothetical protein